MQQQQQKLEEAHQRAQDVSHGRVGVFEHLQVKPV